MRAWLFVLVACSYTPRENNNPAAIDARATDATVIGEDGPTGQCSIGSRVCVDSKHSGVCNPGHVAVTDRDCPPASTCTAGYCAPPADAGTCEQTNDCTGQQVCDLYIVAGVLTGFCTDPFGDATGDCPQTGNDPNCNTGICASLADGSERRCLAPCGGSCSGSNQCTNIGNPTVIEGVSTANQNYCVPD